MAKTDFLTADMTRRQFMKISGKSLAGLTLSASMLSLFGCSQQQVDSGAVATWALPHPKENLGKKAAETLLQMIAGRKKDLTYEFDTRVVERESVAECTENGNKK